VRLVNRAIVPPPPAVYSLVCPENDPSGSSPAARVLLHATSPLSQRIEFPNLLDDLALGHVRRLALFTWHTVITPDVAVGVASLIKIDRSGGGQLPTTSDDFQTVKPLPEVTAAIPPADGAVTTAWPVKGAYDL
jgi:hypothetical protein